MRLSNQTLAPPHLGWAVRLQAAWLQSALCAAFAAAYVAVPWPRIFMAIYGQPLEDRRVYEMQLRLGYFFVDLRAYDSWFSPISYEFTWKFIMIFLSRDLGLQPEAIFALISFLTIFAFSITIVRAVGFFWLLLLFNPLVVDFAFSQLRLALAVSIALLLIRLYYRSIWKAVLVALGLASIHTSMILFIFLGAVSKLAATARKASDYRTLVPVVLSGVFVSLLIGPLREGLLGAVGDRRAVYIDMSSSIAYLSYWMLLLGILLYRWKFVQNRMAVALSIAVLSLVAVNLLHSGYSSRFLSAAFPFMIISIASLDGLYRVGMAGAFVAFAVVQWGYWLRLLS